jgi:translation initiation factor 1
MARRAERGDEIYSPEGGAVSRPADARDAGRDRKAKGARRGAPPPPADGVVRVARERRRGSGVTLVTGVPLAGKELARLGKELKQRCGSGGTTRDGVIEIQGDHRDQVVALLQQRGWTVKRVGG